MNTRTITPLKKDDAAVAYRRIMGAAGQLEAVARCREDFYRSLASVDAMAVEDLRHHLAWAGHAEQLARDGFSDLWAEATFGRAAS